MSTKKYTKRKSFSYGWRPELPDARDLRYSAPVSVLRALPPRIDLRDGCPPVVDQGSLGSCTACAIASAHQFGQIKQGGPMGFQPSRLFIYFNERRMAGTIAWDSGAFIRDGFKSLAKEGVCPETLWKYTISKFTDKPAKACYDDALDHQLLQYLRLDHQLAQLKGCLADGYPFVFGFTVYESFESAQVGSDGMVPLPSEGESVRGGHAVMAVGYDDDLQRFIVQNSWGDQWGDDGFFHMPYAYLTDASLSDDFWTMRLVEITHSHPADQPTDLPRLMPGALALNTGSPGVRIDKTDALRRTKDMLVREWGLPKKPKSSTDLRKAPPGGLGKSDLSIRALERPIEIQDFFDVAAAVIGDNLIKAKTVSQLRDRIWDGIPEEHRE